LSTNFRRQPSPKRKQWPLLCRFSDALGACRECAR
jgi:hypothetical protein